MNPRVDFFVSGGGPEWNSGVVPDMGKASAANTLWDEPQRGDPGEAVGQ